MSKWEDWDWDEEEMAQVENAYNVWVLDLEDSIMSETEDFATVTDAPFCGCDICMTRETLAFLLPKIIDLYEAGHMACDNARSEDGKDIVCRWWAPYSVTTKVGGDLLTVRGNSADEFVENLTSLNDNPCSPMPW